MQEWNLDSGLNYKPDQKSITVVEVQDPESLYFDVYLVWFSKIGVKLFCIFQEWYMNFGAQIRTGPRMCWNFQNERSLTFAFHHVVTFFKSDQFSLHGLGVEILNLESELILDQTFKEVFDIVDLKTPVSIFQSISFPSWIDFVPIPTRIKNFHFGGCHRPSTLMQQST